jgi:predicted GIY-YIG superfamily endonuclease
MFAYLVTGPSGKRYVGITSGEIAARWQQHVSAAIARRFNSALHAAIRKYGAEAFSVEQIGSAETWKELCALERSAIAERGTFTPNGYNLTLGGDGTPGYIYANRSPESQAQLSKKIAEANARRTPEERARIAEAIAASKRGKPRPPELIEKLAAQKRGKTHSEEARARMSAGHVGFKHSAESREKMSAIAKARSAESMANFTGCRKGQPVSDETRSRMSEAARARSQATAEKMREIWRQRKAAQAGGAP